MNRLFSFSFSKVIGLDTGRGGRRCAVDSEFSAPPEHAAIFGSELGVSSRRSLVEKSHPILLLREWCYVIYRSPQMGAREGRLRKKQRVEGKLDMGQVSECQGAF